METNQKEIKVYVWVPNYQIGFEPAYLESESETKRILQTVESKTSITVPIDAYEKYPKSNSSVIDKIYPNLTSLPDFTHQAVTYQLYKRYQEDEIYTYIGRILLAINPYKLLPTYTHKYIEMYGKQNKEGKLPPHIYELSEWVYKSMLTNQAGHAVLISGESGSGKTESTKLILQFLSEVAGTGNGIEQSILRSGPVLEAFGNAKTGRNDNSSRFGKWIEIEFSKDEGLIGGAQIQQYLLEKSRVVIRNKSEKNYHAFYAMMDGLDEEKNEGRR